jgi:hypothetical protein
MTQRGREMASLVGLASLFAACLGSGPAWASNSASFMLLGSAQQAVAESAELAGDLTKPAPDSVRSFESLRVQPLSKTVDEEKETRYSVFGFRSAQNSFFLPLYKEQVQTRKDKYQLLDGWGLKWQHDLLSGNSFAVSAHRADNLYQQDDTVAGSSTSTMASFSWTSRWTGDYKPSFTGSVFIGDEVGEADNTEYTNEFGRRYYGFSVGGEMTLFKSHTPYLSLKLQKNEYVDADTGLMSDSLLLAEPVVDPLTGAEMFSRLSAGWNWRVRSNWSVTAEANYTLEDNDFNWNFDQSRLYFGTRYDFR